ncbi:MAG: T9SS C-terminal target domain-containing protein, partial [Flavobacteriales bacterium]
MPIRTILSFLFAIILTPSLLAQSIEWEANYGGDTVDIGKAIVQTFNGGLAVAGYSSSSNGDVGGNEGYFDYWLLRTDSNGSIQWEQNYGGSAFDEAVSIVQTSDSGFAILGNSRSSNGDVGGNNGNLDYWVLKLDESGTIQWEKNYGGSDADVPGSIVQTSDSGFVVAGFSHSQDGDVGGTSGSSDYWVLKLDGSGTIQWDKTYGGTGDDEGRTVVQTSDGGFAVAGYSNSSDGDV